MQISAAPPAYRLGGGVLDILLTTGCTLLPGYRFSPFFSNAGHQKKTILLQPVVKVLFHCFPRIFCRVYFLQIFSKSGYHLEGKTPKLGEKILSWSAHPRIIESQVPHPPTPPPCAYSCDKNIDLSQQTARLRFSLPSSELFVCLRVQRFIVLIMGG